jgi:hypothetical protein
MICASIYNIQFLQILISFYRLSLFVNFIKNYESFKFTSGYISGFIIWFILDHIAKILRWRTHLCDLSKSRRTDSKICSFSTILFEEPSRFHIYEFARLFPRLWILHVLTKSRTCLYCCWTWGRPFLVGHCSSWFACDIRSAYSSFLACVFHAGENIICWICRHTHEMPISWYN